MGLGIAQVAFVTAHRVTPQDYLLLITCFCPGLTLPQEIIPCIFWLESVFFNTRLH